MPLEPQWKALIKIFIITIILGVIIAVVSNTILWTPAMWGALSWIGYLYLLPTIVFVILIYKWAKKYNYI